MWNSCVSVVHNTFAWEPQKNTEKQKQMASEKETIWKDVNRARNKKLPEFQIQLESIPSPGVATKQNQ